MGNIMLGLAAGILGGSFGWMAIAIKRAPHGYEDPKRGFVNLDKAPDYIPSDIMSLPYMVSAIEGDD